MNARRWPLWVRVTITLLVVAGLWAATMLACLGVLWMLGWAVREFWPGVVLSAALFATLTLIVWRQK